VAEFDGNLLEINESWSGTLGYAPAELRGKPLIQFMHPEDRPRLEAAWTALVAGGSPIALAAMRWTCRDGSCKWFAGQAAADGTERLIFTAWRDITEAKRSEARLREAAEAKSDFAAAIAHELGTPMTCVRMGIDTVCEDLPVAPHRRQLLDLAKRNLDRVSRLINEVLDFHRLESGRMQFALAPCDINGLVASAVREAAVAAQARNVTLDVALSSRRTQIFCDGERMAQVLAGLVRCAVARCPGGRVWVSTSDEADGVKVAVRDQSQGLGRHDRGRLALPRMIIEGQGGAFQVKTDPGGVTCAVELRARPGWT
jgi:PAS domain S-box-containing protein